MSLDPRQLPTAGGPSGPANPYHEPVLRDGPEVPDHVVAEIRAQARRFPPGSRSAVMPALDLVQEELGYLTPAGMAQVAAALELDPGYVEGVATFYSLFHLRPIGSHHFYVCNNLSCQLAGAEELLVHLKERIGVTEYGEVGANGRFSCEPVECLGACEYAPVMRYNHALHYDLTPAAIDGMVDSAAAAPGPGHKPGSARGRRHA